MEHMEKANMSKRTWKHYIHSLGSRITIGLTFSCLPKIVFIKPQHTAQHQHCFLSMLGSETSLKHLIFRNRNHSKEGREQSWHLGHTYILMKWKQFSLWNIWCLYKIATSFFVIIQMFANLKLIWKDFCKLISLKSVHLNRLQSTLIRLHFSSISFRKVWNYDLIHYLTNLISSNAPIALRIAAILQQQKMASL